MPFYKESTMYQTNSYSRRKLNTQPTVIGNVALLGSQPIAQSLYKNLHLQENIIGFINIRTNEPFRGSITDFPTLLGEVNDIKRIVKKHNIDKILLAVDPNDTEKFSEAIQTCQRENLLFDLPDSKQPPQNGHSQPPDAIYEDSRLYQKFLKTLLNMDDSTGELKLQRAIDLIVSILLFLLFLPSWIVVAIAIKLESSGGILYSQERVGKGGKIFRIYKFRSMYSDAEKRGGPQLATQNDPRITQVGRILRKTRIDELPQLFNVIKGDMSLIGPRPERPYFVEKYRLEIPNYIQRLLIKPGLTGHAQVETGYDETLDDVRKKLEHDLYYIERRKSWKLYFQIVYKTIWVVLTARGQ